MRRIGSGLFGVVMALALSACGTLDRPTGPLRITDGTLVKAQDPRIRASDNARLQAELDAVANDRARVADLEALRDMQAGGAARHR